MGLVAFGFEATNLTLHHDDVIQIFIQDTILGHYLGRFGVGWLHYYTQNAYFVPFVQMIEAILLMAAYGVLVAHFWGLRRALDISLVAAILCVFPYMAQVHQYNAAVATYSAAHLLAAAALVLSTRATLIHGAIAALLYLGAFSIYQAVAANAATIFVFWLLTKLVFREEREPFLSSATAKSIAGAIASVLAGGALYLVCISFMAIPFDSYQSAEKAFTLQDALNLQQAIPAILQGTRSFFFWPEAYFPNYLKKLQLLFVLAAAVLCLWLPRGLAAKATGGALLALALFTPRALQLLHAGGNYHALALTAYAVVITGSVMMVHRSGLIVLRNASALFAAVLIGGYVLQCGWISTVNHLNTLAHYATLSQILARARSIPGAPWDGKKIAVVGRYEMPRDYPFRAATGVATRFMDAEHMDKLARLMRDEATFVPADQTMPKVLQYAAARAPWPHPESVAVVDGMAVVVFGRPQP